MPFCEDCLVELRGRRVCAGCKPAALREIRRRTGAPDRQANEALTFSLIGLVPCLVPFLGPVGLLKGIAALRAHAANPNLESRGKAIAAIAVAAVALVLWTAVLAFWIANGWN
jgi:hypothetical protein